MEKVIGRTIYVLLILIGAYSGLNFTSIVALIVVGSSLGTTWGFVGAGVAWVATVWVFHLCGRWICESLSGEGE